MEQAHNSEPGGGPAVVFLSTVFISDRMLLHSETLPSLAEWGLPVVWSRASTEPHFEKHLPAAPYFEPFPGPAGMRRPLTLLRHLADFTWDHRLRSVSRDSFWRLRKRGDASFADRVLRQMARPLAAMGLAPALDRAVRRYAVSSARADAIEAELKRLRPKAMVLMVPWGAGQILMGAIAQRLGIKTYALITSWDNLSTKGRMGLRHDGYFVWSEQMGAELLAVEPEIDPSAVHNVGSLQYDRYVSQAMWMERGEFWPRYGVDPARRVVLYCLGSPRLIDEKHAVEAFAKATREDPEMAGVQIVVRPHPAFHFDGFRELEDIAAADDRVVIQNQNKHWSDVPYQSVDGLKEWVNSIRHADVVVNLSSTIAVDACMYDRPVVNLNFDPAPNQANRELVAAINTEWAHFAPVARSGGLAMADDVGEMVAATKRYLANPALDAEGRRQVVEWVCGSTDGRAGVRMAEQLGRDLGGCGGAE